MTSEILQEAAVWLEEQRDTHNVISIVYEGDGDTVTLDATIGRTRFEVDRGGFLEKFESRDFLLLVAELILNGVATEPKRGHKIKETRNGVTFVYEVASPGNEPHFRFSDLYRITFRIHTKETGRSVFLQSKQRIDFFSIRRFRNPYTWFCPRSLY